MLLINLKQEYIYLIVFIVLSLILSVFLLLLSYSISHKKKNDIEKLSAYECGFDPYGTGVSSFEVHFYVVGILFIIFDLELIFLYPWAVRFGVLGGSGFFVVMVFLSILTLGFIYEWEKGALDWSKSIILEKKPEAENTLKNCTADVSSPKAESKDIWYRAFFSFSTKCGYFYSLPARAKLFWIMIKDYFHSIPIPVRAKLFWIIIRDDFNLLKKDVSYGVFLIFVFFPFLVFLFYVKGEPEVYFILEVLFFLFVSGVRNSFFFPSRWKLESVLNQLQNVCGFTAILYLLILDGSRPDPFFWCYYFGMKYTRLFEDNIYLVYDKYTETAKFILLFCTFFFLFISMEFLITQAESQGINLVEFPVIVCFSVFFMLVLVSSFNFFGAYVSLEGITFSLYILAGMNYNSQNALESGVKYFCLGAISSGFLLFGVALIFIMTKTLDFRELRFLFESLKELPLLLSFALIFVFFGFWFKLSIFPCHAWTPDVYEGVFTPVTLFLATIVKLSIFAFFVRILFFLLGTKLFLFFWKPLFLFVATGSILIGAFGALIQTKIKRFIGYTSINQMGYLFIGVSSGDLLGLQSSFLYLFFYIIMAFSFFLVVLSVKELASGKEILFINQLNQFGLQHRNLSFFLALVLFSMAGIPPLAGFLGKFFLFFSAFSTGNYSLIVLGLVMNVISAFYYLRLVKCLFFDGDKKERSRVYVFFYSLSPFSTLLTDTSVCSLFFILFYSPFCLNILLRYFEWITFSCCHSRLIF